MSKLNLFAIHRWYICLCLLQCVAWPRLCSGKYFCCDKGNVIGKSGRNGEMTDNARLIYGQYEAKLCGIVHSEHLK